MLGNKTKWALGLGILGLFCCGPFSTIPGIILAKMDMDEIASGRMPNGDDTWAKVAFYGNIGVLILSILFMCLFWGMRGLRHF